MKIAEKIKRVLLIGPFPDPITGVSLANKIVLDNLTVKGNYKVDHINTSYNKFDENLGAFSISKLLFYLKQNLRSYKIIKSDIVYITPGQTFFGLVKYSLFILLTKFLRKELIIHIHGNYIGREYLLLRGFKKKLFKYLLGKTSKGIVLSESLVANMSPFIDKNKIHILYNFVEDYLFVDKEMIQGKMNSFKPRIVFLSNLMEEKGIFELLEALKILEEKGIDYEAKIAGNIDAMQNEKVESYFKRLKNTKYCGVVSGEEKKELLLWGNIFVLPTYYKMEGQPISILEAMVTGNLILTTKHAGIPDIFKDSINGYYIEKKDKKSIVEKIIESHKNGTTSDEIRLFNYKHAIKKYRVENFINKTIQIFET